MKTSGLLLVLTTVLVLAAPAVAQEPEKDVKARFWEARRVMLKGDAASAAELFKTLVGNDPRSEVADDCLYWMGRCYLRMPDHEPAAAVAFVRLVREHPESPFVDDAARELHRLGDRTVVPDLTKRLEGEGKAAELAARGLEEFGVESGVLWLEKRGVKSRAENDEQADKKAAEGSVAEEGNGEAELRRLRDEVRRLKKEVEENVALLKKLLEKAAAEKAGGSGR